MSKITENKMDKLLEDIRERSVCKEDIFKPEEQFKAEFFQKVKSSPARTAAKRFTRIYLPIAAAFLICSGICVHFMTTEPNAPAHETLVLPEDKVTSEDIQSKFAETPVNAAIAAPVDAALPPAAAPKAYRAAKRKSAAPVKLSKSAPRAEPALAAPAASEFDYPQRRFSTAEYKTVKERGFSAIWSAPLSTFGADVDTANYTLLRSFLREGNTLPPPDMVRTEELLNYFSYDYKAPGQGRDFHVNFESMDAPWAKERKLLLIGVQAKQLEAKELPPSNFVFLIDNSGSMTSDFPMVIEAMTTLADKLRKCDRISIVTYGGGVNVLLDGGNGTRKELIKRRIRALRADGYTPGGQGIQTAYKLARKHFIKGGNNRVVLITDGDFNVGISSEAGLIDMIKKERRSAIYLSAFGVGWGNFRDNKLKVLANSGNGNYTYLDNVREAKRVMNNEMTGKMFTIAKDVKFQIEFNPAKVAGYRLIGYQMRELAAQDFNDDSKDSGEVGIGHQVTAVYELIMTDAPEAVQKKYLGKTDALKYVQGRGGSSDDILTFKLRYQKPEGNSPSRLMSIELKKLPPPTDNIRWAAAVTEFSLLLRRSEFKGNADFRTLRRRAQKLIGSDNDGKRADFLTLIKAAEDLSK